jgi:hypothetical protein
LPATRAPKARRISAQRNALGLKDPQQARPERAREILSPLQGGTPFDRSFPARCAGLILVGAFSAEDNLARLYPFEMARKYNNRDNSSIHNVFKLYSLDW